MRAKLLGRPTLYTPELGDRICAGISGGKSLRKVCSADTMPDRRSAHRWLRQDAAFCHHHARACEERAHDLAEQLLEIADARVPLVEGRMDPGAVQNKRVRIDTRRWLASKLFPKVYGDRVVAEVSGPERAPVPIALSPMDWDALIKRTTGQLGTEPGSPQEAAGSADEA